jgi:putative ABC transport system permease protein
MSLNNLDATGDILRVPGYALFDRKSKSSYGDVIGRLRRDGSVQIETAIIASPLQSPLTIIGTYALGGTIVYYGTALMSAETLSNVTAQPLERVNMGVLKLQPGADPQTVAQQLGASCRHQCRKASPAPERIALGCRSARPTGCRRSPRPDATT